MGALRSFCALDPHFCRARTDYYPTLKAALCHESADSEEDREGLGCHLGQGLCVHSVGMCRRIGFLYKKTLSTTGLADVMQRLQLFLQICVNGDWFLRIVLKHLKKIQNKNFAVLVQALSCKHTLSVNNTSETEWYLQSLEGKKSIKSSWFNMCEYVVLYVPEKKKKNLESEHY